MGCLVEGPGDPRIDVGGACGHDQRLPVSHALVSLFYSPSALPSTALWPAQEKKQLVFEGTVGRDVEALSRLTEDDLRFLFS